MHEHRGERVADLLNAFGLILLERRATYADLGRFLGVSGGTVGRWINGRARIPVEHALGLPDYIRRVLYCAEVARLKGIPRKASVAKTPKPAPAPATVPIPEPVRVRRSTGAHFTKVAPVERPSSPPRFRGLAERT